MKAEYTEVKALEVLKKSGNVTINGKLIAGNNFSLRQCGAVDFLIKKCSYLKKMGASA